MAISRGKVNLRKGGNLLYQERKGETDGGQILNKIQDPAKTLEETPHDLISGVRD